MTTSLRYSLLILFLFLAGIITLNAQRTPQNPDQGLKPNPVGSSNSRDTLDSGILPVDTPVTMTYVVISDPDDEHSFLDTFLWEDNSHFPLPYHYSHLGNYGSPARPLAPSINMKHG